MNAFLWLVFCACVAQLQTLADVETPRFPGQAIPLPHLAQAPGTRKGWNLGSLGAAAVRDSVPLPLLPPVRLRFGSALPLPVRAGLVRSNQSNRQRWVGVAAPAARMAGGGHGRTRPPRCELSRGPPCSARTPRGASFRPPRQTAILRALVESLVDPRERRKLIFSCPIRAEAREAAGKVQRMRDFP